MNNAVVKLLLSPFFRYPAIGIGRDRPGPQARERAGLLRTGSDKTGPAPLRGSELSSVDKMNWDRLVKVGALASIILAASHSAWAQDLRDARFMERAQAGFSDIFNLDYEKAERDFISLERDYPQHPAPPLYLASIVWLKELVRRQDLSLNRFIYPGYFSRKTNESMPSQDRAAFSTELQKSESLAGAILRRNSKDKDGRYFLSTTYSLRASFAITVDHNVRESFSNARKAFSYGRDLIEDDRNYYDAYLTVGLYEYIVGSIPWYFRWMAFVAGLHGSKEEGMQHLKLASAKGQYVQNEAQLIEMVLDLRERRYPEALEIAGNLSNRFPRNYLFALNTAQIMEWSGKWDQAIELLLEINRQVEAKEPNFDKLPPARFHFITGVELMNMKKLELAEEQFRKALADPQIPAREKALAHLRLARILDSKGQRNEAVKEYRIVLSLEDVEQSHSQARQALNR
jgi:tetratricopeptide (TPR) repeat protein